MTVPVQDHPVFSMSNPSKQLNEGFIHAEGYAINGLITLHNASNLRAVRHVYSELDYCHGRGQQKCLDRLDFYFGTNPDNLPLKNLTFSWSFDYCAPGTAPRIPHVDAFGKYARAVNAGKYDPTSYQDTYLNLGLPSDIGKSRKIGL